MVVVTAAEAGSDCCWAVCTGVKGGALAPAAGKVPPDCTERLSNGSLSTARNSTRLGTSMDCGESGTGIAVALPAISLPSIRPEAEPKDGAVDAGVFSCARTADPLGRKSSAPATAMRLSTPRGRGATLHASSAGSQGTASGTGEQGPRLVPAFCPKIDGKSRAHPPLPVLQSILGEFARILSGTFLTECKLRHRRPVRAREQGSGVRDQGSEIRDQASGVRDQGHGSEIRGQRAEIGLSGCEGAGPSSILSSIAKSGARIQSDRLEEAAPGP